MSGYELAAVMITYGAGFVIAIVGTLFWWGLHDVDPWSTAVHKHTSPLADAFIGGAWWPLLLVAGVVISIGYAPYYLGTRLRKRRSKPHKVVAKEIR